jgi:MFS family permease
MIPALIFAWSIVIIGSGFVHNANQLYACRLLLGLFESGMFPCLALYLSTFYLPGEQALRISYLFVSSALSGAFGGYVQRNPSNFYILIKTQLVRI